ncbi:MAG TPA: WecB/TagA/CpsF family glycosyltransferase [Terriglobales bacterium]|nr:WecB/TagA/CpsF family glycosyltransferase [Terriglobales bacterium]
MAARKKNILGVMVDAVNYEQALALILDAARNRRPCSVSALAVHGVMTGALDAEHRYRLNHLDLLVPDGQPVRWAMNLLYRTELRERVYGPQLTLNLCQAAAEAGLPIYFYGSTPEILKDLESNLRKSRTEIRIVGSEPSLFRQLTEQESAELAERVKNSGAALLFVGLGCPRQEVFAFEFRDRVSIPIIAVGAAFPFIAGSLAQAPRRFQDYGLEWLFRLWVEPARLWRRYLILNPVYVLMLGLQALYLKRYSAAGELPSQELRYG